MYIRTEYPLAIKGMQTAISQSKEHGLLGENILGTGFDFDIEIREGSGAFVCGEETALIHSIEGKIPEPTQRPPYPAQVGIWGCPTVINNVETLANVPVIMNRSAEWYSKIGTQTSKGTKIFSLVGKINNSGLIEVPMGITLREIIYDIGGGIPGNKKFKAVQTGGPSGGCIPNDHIDLPIDYESLQDTDSIMGSGGMIVMDEDTCMVDVSKFFIQFTNDESCGKCTTCRDGSEALLEVLTRITEGEGQEGDLEYLEELGLAIRDASMCGLGTTLPNPVLSTIKYFKDEYEAHIQGKNCPALVCRDLIKYYILAEKCVGCLLCLKDCPAGAIQGELKHIHLIDQSKCTKCGICLEVCPPKVSAVVKVSGEEARALKTLEKPLPVEMFRKTLEA
jgi:NADH:ubiquinone oxidoreductase subunit F (NADH-binding)/Fe-S-cluster-containing hydrogenase component 2